MNAILLPLLLTSLPAEASALDKYAAMIKAAPVVAGIDSRGTFRDLALGTKCSTVPGFTVAKEASNWKSYSRATDKLAIGTGELKSIRYVCVDDSLRVVLMSVPEGSVVAVATAMVGTYGKPSIQEDKLAYWRGVKRAAWLGRFDGEGDYMLSIGDFPWADPVGLILMVTAGNAQAGATDL